MADEPTLPEAASPSAQQASGVLKSTPESQSGTSRSRELSSRNERDRKKRRQREQERERERERERHRRKGKELAERREGRSHHRDEHRRDEDRKHRRRHRHHGRDHDSPPDDKKALTKYQIKDLAAQSREPDESLFFLDKRGDPLISRYGTNDRSKVPLYRRHGSGRLLGSETRFTITRDGARDEFSTDISRDRGSVFREKHTALLKAGRSKGHRIKSDLIAQEPLESGDQAQDFISLGRPEVEQQRPDESSAASDEEGPSYRSIHGKAKAHEFSDSDLDYQSDDSAAAAAAPDDDLRKQRSIELSRQVKDQPGNVDAWLELVGLQDYLISKEFGTQSRTADEKRSLADIKLSMLEKALPHAASQGDRGKVVLQLMHVGSQIWNPEDVAKRWQDTVEEHPDSFDLWRARMDFQSSNLSTFTFDRIKTLYLERIKYLQQQIEATSVVPGADTGSLCSHLIYVFSRMTRFLQDSGYSELAVAAWQAVLELTFSRPLDLRQTRASDVVKANISDFWESEVARIGEPRAKGWSHFAEASDMIDVPESKVEETQQPPQTRDAYKAWAGAEKQQMARSTLPARTLDEDGDEDPFRVVMFSDIEDFLFVLPLPISSQVRLLLLDCFLLFCQVVPYARECSWIHTARDDPFIANGTSDLAKASSLENTQDHDREGATKIPRFSHPNGHFAAGPDTCFSGPGWFTSRASCGQQTSHAPLVSLATLATRHLVRSGGVDELAAFSLMLDHAADPTGVKKSGKVLLKLYPFNIPLYNSYALAEKANGNGDVAAKVLTAAASPDSGSRPEDAMLLWNTWAWIELQSGQNDLAVQRLCGSSVAKTDGLEATVAPSQLLKTRQQLSSTRDYQLSIGNRDTAAVYAQSYALLEYLTAGTSEESTSNRQGNLASALDTVFWFSGELSSRGHEKALAHELFLQFAAKLIYFHASHGPYRPTYMRQQLLRFIALFPKNTIFLHLFSWAESSLRLNDPVREVLRTKILLDPYDTLSSRVFAIQHELRVGNVYSAHAAFESAVASPACKGCVGLWRAYVRFCHESRELKPKSRDVFYKAIKECPWSKELMMEAFGVLVKDMDSGELRAVYGTIQAKGLRVHVDLEDYMAKWKAEQKAASKKRHR